MRLFTPLLVKRFTRAKTAFTNQDTSILQELQGVEPPQKQKELEPIPFDVTEENRFEIVNRVVCPLHVVTYDNQLKIKYSKVKNLLSAFGRKIKYQGNSPITLDSQGLPCPVDFTKRSPKITEYRNKDEFSIWPGVDGNRKTVGFFIGEPSAHNNVVCVEPDKIMITKKSHRILASRFQHYLRNVSPLDVCTNFSEGGNWRRFVVRSNEEGEHMVICQMHPQELLVDQIDEEKERLKTFFSSLSEELRIQSLYFQSLKTSRSPDEKDPYHLLFGDPTLQESLLGKRFQISPESFFQVNTLAAEVLYETIINEVNPTRDLTIIDLCSGTGTMSVLLAPSVRRVIAIEQSKQAVSDAKRNSQINEARNITFIQGIAEDVLPNLADQLFGQRVVIIANPGRGGLRSSAISTIREMSQVEKVIYIACKPSGEAMKNFVHLSLSEGRNREGSPFIPVNAIPVDLFPHTEHVELVLTFERFDF